MTEGRLSGFSASLGVATFPECGETAETLILAADRALYAAKASGKNRVTMADGGRPEGGRGARDPIRVGAKKTEEMGPPG